MTDHAKHTWAAVDAFFGDRLLPPDSALDAAQADSEAAGLPPIQVTAAQGKLLQLLARMIGARSILEIGTLGGYSTIWLARALPAGGRLVTIEMDSKHADVATANLERAGVAALVDLRLGRALDVLPQLDGPFDFVFVDADKASTPEYFEWALRLTHPGSAIVVDNVVRSGAVADATSTDPDVRGIRRLADQLHGDDRVSTTAIQTVGSKSYDGFLLAIVN